MAITLIKAKELSKEISQILAGNQSEWRRFLMTAGRLYKYSYRDQMMIYAQRPDATAVASFETWKEKTNRYIRRGAKGIALFTPGGEGLKYVFDIADTGQARTKDKTKQVTPPWKMGKRHTEAVFSNLELGYGLESLSHSPHERLQSIVSAAVSERFPELYELVEGELSDSFLADVDVQNRETILRQTVEASATYMVLARMGVDPELYLDEEDFSQLWNFNTPTLMAALGNCTTGIATPILREVERTIKEIDLKISEKSLANSKEERYNEFSDLKREHEGGTTYGKQSGIRGEKRDTVPEYHDGSAAGGHREVREHESEVSGGTPPSQIRRASNEGRTENPSAGSERTGTRDAGQTDGGVRGEKPFSEQRNRSNGLDTAPEPSESTGGGNYSERTDFHLNDTDKMPSLGGGIFASTSEITENEIGHVLTRGNVVEGGKGRILSFFLEEHSEKEKMDFLKQEYGIGGRTHALPNTEHSYVAYNGKGLSLSKGNILSPDAEITLTWSNVAKRTQQLIDHGLYLSSEEIEVLPDKLRQSLERRNPFGRSDVQVEQLDMFSFFPNIPSPEAQIEDELIYAGIEEYRTHKKHGTFSDVSDFIEQEDLSEEIEVTTESTIPHNISVNFHITDDRLGEGGQKAKYQANIFAISTLKQMEAENRQATPEEQEILSRYVGWGGLPQAFDEHNEKWQREYAELKELLTDEEYNAARRSTLNAHYTSPTVITSIYSVLEKTGFSKGNILEPALGVGNFFGKLPAEMNASKLYGVELDSISSRIAQKLYPNANIQNNGFENTNFPDNFFDVAVGNVPFGSLSVADKRYDKHKFFIHDYFFAKTLDKVRPGGIIAFVTSSGTLDKSDPKVRTYLAQRADLLGAIRLPNTAFKANAGTEVTTDILFLKKRDSLRDIPPDWIQLGKTEDGVPVNQYFIDHPEMILGKMVFDRSMYGSEKDTACHPIPGADFSAQLQAAAERVRETIQGLGVTLDDIAELEAEAEVIPADPDIRNHSYVVVENVLYFRENSIMRPVEMNATAEQRCLGMMKLRDAARAVIDCQTTGRDNSVLLPLQERLGQIYDEYTEQYGLLNDRGNRLAFAEDSSYPLLCSLEVLNEDGSLKRKADLFTKRTILAYAPVTHVDTAQEALAVSLSEKACVDMGFMCSLSDKTAEQISKELSGVIFKDHHSEPDNLLVGWQTADGYLSGNVRKKLKEAKQVAEKFPSFLGNAEALRLVQPVELTATEIEVRLGSTWIPQEDYTAFLHDFLGVPFGYDDKFTVHYTEYTGEYRVQGNKHLISIQTALNETYGTRRIDAIDILKRTLNQKTAKVYDIKLNDEGNEVRVLNAKETQIAQNRQEKLKRAFKEFIWREPDRRERLCKKYNEIYNANRPREFDGSHLIFPGMNPEVALRPHQKNGVARGLYGGNTLLAHVVGAGKTYTMAALAIEQKRLGLANKSLFVVPNHLTEQWGSEFLQLYPGADILVATKKDFEPANRKRFCARIATGNYDAVIIGHSQFEKIPLSKERQEAAIRREVEEVSMALSDMRSDDNTPRYTIKQMERVRANLEERLKKLTDDTRKDEVVTFEELGVDRLFVDEAHAYKNLYLHTKMQNVAGITSSAAQRSSDMYAKTGYIDELTSNKGVIFATGTPISNSMAEMYTMERYLMRGELKAYGLSHFDEWASTFGDTQTAMELSPEGTGFRMKTRFAKFFNLPEAVGMFKEVADIQTADMLNLPRPEARYHDVVLEPSELQQDIVMSLADRAENVRNRVVEPHEDNMLKITTDGRKAALDIRILNPLFPDDPNNKASACVQNVARIYEETKEQKSTQLVFCDLSTPNGAPLPIELVEGEDGVSAPVPEQFVNVYHALKQKMIEKGVPEEEVAFIHDAKTDKQKADLFAKVRSGDVRVLIGSTSKMGAGTNVQNKLKALHHLDVPWKPSDIEQQEGRILRQGNDNKEADIYRYITKGTFDAYSWQIIENKQKFIGQIMTGKNPARSCEDLDETALSYAEVKALATGDPRIKEKMDLDVRIATLRTLKADYLAQRFRFEDDLSKHIPKEMQGKKEQIARFETAEKSVSAHPMGGEQFSMVVDGQIYTERKEAGEALIALCLAENRPEGVIGSYRGFEMRILLDEFSKQYQIELKNGAILSAEMSSDPVGVSTRIHNITEKVPEILAQKKADLVGLEKRMETIREELKKPFDGERELEEKEERSDTLIRELEESGKEQAAGRKLSKDDPSPEIAEKESNSISGFLQSYEPPAPSLSHSEKNYDDGLER